MPRTTNLPTAINSVKNSAQNNNIHFGGFPGAEDLNKNEALKKNLKTLGLPKNFNQEIQDRLSHLNRPVTEFELAVAVLNNATGEAYHDNIENYEKFLLEYQAFLDFLFDENGKIKEHALNQLPNEESNNRFIKKFKRDNSWLRTQEFYRDHLNNASLTDKDKYLIQSLHFCMAAITEDLDTGIILIIQAVACTPEVIKKVSDQYNQYKQQQISPGQSPFNCPGNVGSLIASKDMLKEHFNGEREVLPAFKSEVVSNSNRAKESFFSLYLSAQQAGTAATILTIGTGLIFGGLFTTAFSLAHGNLPLAGIGIAATVVGAGMASVGMNSLLKVHRKTTNQVLHKMEGVLHTLTSCASTLFCCKVSKAQFPNKAEEKHSVDKNLANENRVTI